MPLPVTPKEKGPFHLAIQQSYEDIPSKAIHRCGFIIQSPSDLPPSLLFLFLLSLFYLCDSNNIDDHYGDTDKSVAARAAPSS